MYAFTESCVVPFNSVTQAVGGHISAEVENFVLQHLSENMQFL